MDDTPNSVGWVVDNPGQRLAQQDRIGGFVGLTLQGVHVKSLQLRKGEEVKSNTRIGSHRGSKPMKVDADKLTVPVYDVGSDNLM
jgi:hypothetical protein